MTFNCTISPQRETRDAARQKEPILFEKQQQLSLFFFTIFVCVEIRDKAKTDTRNEQLTKTDMKRTFLKNLNNTGQNQTEYANQFLFFFAYC